MTTICCVKCPDCKSNPKQSPAPAQPSSLELIGLSSWLCQIQLVLPAVGEGWQRSHPPGLSSLVPTSRHCLPALLPGTKEHTFLARPPKLLSNKRHPQIRSACNQQDTLNQASSDIITTPRSFWGLCDVISSPRS